MRKNIVMSVIAAALCVGPLAGVASAEPATDQNRFCATNLDTGTTHCADTAAAAKRQVGATALTIAIFYDGVSHGGATYTWVQSRACTPSYDSEWQWDNLAEIGWNNRVTSVRTYNQCDVKFFDGFNFSGATSTWIDQSGNLANIGGGWNNRAGSVKFS